MASKTEQAIDYIAKQGNARSPELSAATGVPVKDVPSLLYPYVRAGILVACKIDQPGKPPCNEYRLGTSVTPKTWRDHKVGIFSEKKPKPEKPTTPPAHTPAAQPKVAGNNSGSTPSVNSHPPAEGRAVAKKPASKALAKPALDAGGHVAPASEIKFGYWSDGSVEIIDGDEIIYFAPADAKRLADFLMNCMISTEVNA